MTMLKIIDFPGILFTTVQFVGLSTVSRIRKDLKHSALLEFC
jgi:hypothetical protein